MLETMVFVGVLGWLFTYVGIRYSWMGSDEALLRYTREDGLVEWLQFLLFFSTSMFMLFIHYYNRVENGMKWVSWASFGMIVVALAFFFGAMEEISWAQRLVDRDSSAFFTEHNLQGETNLHNMEVRGLSINKLVFGKILFLVILFHNIILPIWAEHKKWAREFFNDKMGGFFTPLFFVVFYIVGAIGAEMIDHYRRKELLELTGALHYATIIFLAYALGYKRSGALFKSKNALYASRAFMFFLILLVGLAWMLSQTVRTAPLSEI